MACELAFSINRSASCFHAAAALAGGATLTDEAVATALAEPLDMLVAALDVAGLPREAFFEHLIGNAARVEPHRQQAQKAVELLEGRERTAAVIDRLVAPLAALKHAYSTVTPQLLDELEARSRPLREQWESRGPGLLAGTGRKTEAELIPERAEVLLVSPVLGGAGRAYIRGNTVRIEAVLTNPIPELPEPVRLAWMISQLQADVPRFIEPLAPARAAAVMPLAMLLPTLEAAAEVEWVSDPAQMLPRAIEAWRPMPSASENLAETLTTWWHTYRAGRPPWRVALMALDKMIIAD